MPGTSNGDSLEFYAWQGLVQELRSENNFIKYMGIE